MMRQVALLVLLAFSIAVLAAQDQILIAPEDESYNPDDDIPCMSLRRLSFGTTSFNKGKSSSAQLDRRLHLAASPPLRGPSPQSAVLMTKSYLMAKEREKRKVVLVPI